MRRLSRFHLVAVLAALAGCVTVPSGPGVMVLPGTGKNFDQFRADDAMCKQFASEQVNGQTPDSVVASSGFNSAAVGTILGAVAGAAINGGRGAGVGAGAGMALGGLAGTGAAQASVGRLQQRYDFGYQQCMYAQGHRIPASRGGLMDDFFYGRQSRYYPPPPPPSGTLQK